MPLDGGAELNRAGRSVVCGAVSVPVRRPSETRPLQCSAVGQRRGTEEPRLGLAGWLDGAQRQVQSYSCHQQAQWEDWSPLNNSAQAEAKGTTSPLIQIAARLLHQPTNHSHHLHHTPHSHSHHPSARECSSGSVLIPLRCRRCWRRSWPSGATAARGPNRDSSASSVTHTSMHASTGQQQ